MRRALPIAVTAGVSAVLCACTYEKTVYWRPALAAAPGAVTGGEPFNEKPKGYRDPTQVEGGRIRLEDEDGRDVLVARSARHLMAHIYATIENEERDLFTRQVLCEATREEFRARGMDPGEAFDMLRNEHRADIAALFGRMPMGEYSPGVTMRPIGGGVTRVAMDRRAADGLRWRGFDMVWEGGRMETVGPERPEPVGVPTLEEAVEETGSISGAVALIERAKRERPQRRFVQSGWKLRWFVPVDG